MVRSSKILIRGSIGKKVHGTDVYFKIKGINTNKIYHYKGKVFTNGKIIKICQIPKKTYDKIN
jgi:hypothetical protein